jgi:hypothetical protein
MAAMGYAVRQAAQPHRAAALGSALAAGAQPARGVVC